MDDETKSESPGSRPSTAKVVEPEASRDMSDALLDEDPSAHSEPPTTASQSKPTATAKLENIPFLAPSGAHPPESSFMDSPTNLENKHSDSQAELVVRNHLQDIESSFNAPLSPIPASHNGLDDTFLFDSPSKKPKMQVPVLLPDEAELTHEIQRMAPSHSESTSVKQEASDASLAEPHAQFRGADTSAVTSSLEAFSSSPTAAAAARTISRALSRTSLGASTGQSEHEPEHIPSQSDEDYTGEMSADLGTQETTSQQEARSEESSLLRPNLSPHRLSSVDAGSTPGHALKVNKRPKFLRSRNGSQRSSVSSLLTDPESDVTVGMGADYALQSGGAVSSLGLPRMTSNPLSRSISIGSMVSGFDDYPDSGPPLETLEETSPRQTDFREDLLQTPKAKVNHGSFTTAPTDTVIARHVRNVQVPESLAREYKNKGGLLTPRRPSEFGATESHMASTTRSRPGGRNLTLKEQSSTIERLSKENFDLKLKVMFLSDRLDKLSEEGIKEMISENVELKTGIAILQRDNKMLRRRVKELEKKAKDDDERPGTARSGQSDDDQGAYGHDAQEREEELTYLREQVEEYVTEIERLRAENLNKEAERRRMTEVVRSLGEKGAERMSESFERQEEADVWKDLLEQETARREQSDEDNRRLRDEIFRLKQEMSSHPPHSHHPGGGLHHTTNIYNITKKPRDLTASPSRPATAVSGDIDPSGSMSQGSTLVDELRRESEQLRHENAELRREVGAQTSMLTSRNREKERLYQEIEDLKLAQRRGAPAPSTIDTLLERSASRAGIHERPQSRIGPGSRRAGTALDDTERDELETRLAELRDKNNELKLQNQDLQQGLSNSIEDLEAAAEARKQAEEMVAALQEDVETAMTDLMALQAERDEALQEHANLEGEFEALRKEAQEEIDALEGEADQRTGEIERLQLDVSDRTEAFSALQEEMRKVSDALVRLEDEQDNKLRRIQQLEDDLADANGELEELENKLLEANDKAQRLSVQQESSQGEIAFLREEQEGDKIRIGDLEAALANAEQNLREEKDQARELEQRLGVERRQREMVATKEKEEVQQIVNNINREFSAAKDEARRLRKNLTSREVEAAEWKERLLELENNLREALGDLNGTRSSLLKSIAKLQRDLENTVRDLDSTKASLLEKDHIIKQRDALLESHGLESRKLAENLDKERQAHRSTKVQFETFQRSHQHVTRTVNSQDNRILELESGKAEDKKRIAQLENRFKEQLTDRNNVLLALWQRLSALCGSDWAHDNSLINGRALPSLEAVTTMLPGFSKNLMAAVKMIEGIISGFQGKIKNVEKDLWREYQNLEAHLETRTKKLDRLETIVRNGVATGTLGGEAPSRLARLEEAYRQLQVENHTLRTEVRARTAYSVSENPDIGSPSPSVPTGPRDRPKTSRGPKSSSRGTSLPRPGPIARSSSARTEPLPGEVQLVETDDSDKKWMLRLRDLEYKLKSEREARVQDRSEAMKRLNASETETLMLRENLEREKKKSR